MTFVRHRDRHLKGSFVGVVNLCLEETGWLEDGGYAGLGRVEVIQEPVDASLLKPVKGNTVFVDFGRQFAIQDVQLGSGVLAQKYPVFVDVLAENSTVAGMIAEDLRDRLYGLIGGSRYLPVVHQVTGMPLSGFSCEVVEVFKESPDPKVAHWVSLKVGVRVLFPGEGS